MLVGSILIGADELVGELVKARIPCMQGKSWGPYTALGVVRRGTLLGGGGYHNYQKFDIQLSCAFDQVGWALPKTLRALFDYPFNALHCVRVTCVVGRKNEKARKLLLDLGFKLEGVRRKALDGREDEIDYGLLKEDCRWIHGQEINTSRTRAA